MSVWFSKASSTSPGSASVPPRPREGSSQRPVTGSLGFIVVVALLVMCGAATGSAADRENGDLFVGAASVWDSFGNTVGGIWRIRNGSATLFCSSPVSSFDPGFWNIPFSVILDSRGRVVFLAPIGKQNYGLLRCDAEGAPAEHLALLRHGNDLLDGWPDPLPDVHFERVGYLHVFAQKAVSENLDKLSKPKINNLDNYEFVAQRNDCHQTPGFPCPSELFNYALNIDSNGDETGEWQHGFGVPEVPNPTGNLTSVVVGDAYYMLNSDVLRRTELPLQLTITGTVGGTDFKLTGGLFGGSLDVIGPAVDDTTVANFQPDGWPACDGRDGISTLMPINNGGITPLEAGPLIWDEQNGYHLVAQTGYGPMPGPYMVNVDSALLHPDRDPRDGFFHDAFYDCNAVPWLQFAPIMPWQSSQGGDNSVDVLATAPGGLVGTQYWGNSVVRVAEGDRLFPIASLFHPQGIAAFPPSVPTLGTALWITIQSPVDVLVTDSSGRRIGVDPATGNAVNDFGVYGYDSGPGEPRIFGINNPAAGPFTLAAVGTGDGPYTITVASADLHSGGTDAIQASGITEPGKAAEHDFSLAADSTLAFAASADTTPPVVNCAAPDTGWHAADVSLGCTASDSGSGLADALDASFQLATSVPAGVETATATTASRDVCDVAGNCLVAGPLAPIKVDKRAPTIQIGAPGAGPYLLNQQLAADYTCVDGGSGVASCRGAVASGSAISTATVGAQSFTVASADAVGNSATARVDYSVSYSVCPLYDSSKAAKSGSTVALKVQLCDAGGGNVSSDAVLLHAISLTVVSTSATVDVQAAGNSNPGGDFRYLSDEGTYIFNLKTTGLAAGTYNLNFRAGADPVVHSVSFQVR